MTISPVSLGLVFVMTLSANLTALTYFDSNREPPFSCSGCDNLPTFMEPEEEERADETIDVRDGWSSRREHVFATAREERVQLAVSPPREPIPIGHAVIAVGAGQGQGQVVRRAFMRLLSTFGRCYEPVLLGNPLAAGDIHLLLEVSREGRITGASAYGFDESVATCVATAARALELPRFDAEDHMQVSIPMTFRPYHATVVRR